MKVVLNEDSKSYIEWVNYIYNNRFYTVNDTYLNCNVKYVVFDNLFSVCELLYSIINLFHFYDLNNLLNSNTG